VWVDRADIFPSSPWRPEIEQAVLEAHAFVFVISPESVASEFCQAELAIASGVGKRVVPILARNTPLESIPEELAALHFLSFEGSLEADGSYGESFEAQVDRLVEVLNTDIESLHLHTRLLNQSRLWVQRQDKGLLLRGGELEEAERWLEEQISARRLVLPEQQQLVSASRRAATRRQRGSASVALVVAAVMLVLGIVAFVQRSQAVHQSAVALAGELAAESASASSSNVTTQDLLALEAYRWSGTAQARASLVAAAEQPLERVIPADLGELNQVAYAGKTNLLAAAGVRGITIWHSTTDKELSRPLDSGQTVNGIAFSPNGTLLAAAQNDGAVALFAMPSEKLKGFLPTDTSAAMAVAFGPSGNELAAVTDDGRLFTWDLSTGERASVSIGADGFLNWVAFDPRRPLIAVGGGFKLSEGGDNGLVSIYSRTLASHRTFSQSGTDFTDVAFNPAGRLLSAADNDGRVLLLSASAAKKTGDVQLASTAVAVAFNGSGSLMATSDSQGAVQLWDTSSLKEVGSPMEDGSDVFTVAFSPDGRSLASGDLGGDIVLWSATTFMPGVVTMTGPSVVQLSLSSNSKLVATDNRDGTVDIWDVHARSVLAHLSAGGDPLTSVAFSPHQPTTLAIGDQNGDVSVFNIPSQRPVVLSGPNSVVTSTVFSPDGQRLSVGYTNGEVEVWDLRTRQPVNRFGAPSTGAGQVTVTTFSPDGLSLATAYSNYGIEVFHLTAPTNGDHLASLSRPATVTTTDAIFSLAFTPDGSLLIGGDALGNVELFDASTLRPAATFPGDGSSIFELSVAPDGGTLATADYAGDLQLWDLGTSQKLGNAFNVGSPLLGTVFSQNGKLLVTGANSGEIVLWPSLLWSTDLSAFASDLCPRLGRNLSPAQWRQYVPGRPYQTICPGYPRG
jgi:WD40 repeat protein